jgi:hypothetical protein
MPEASIPLELTAGDRMAQQRLIFNQLLSASVTADAGRS